MILPLSKRSTRHAAATLFTLGFLIGLGAGCDPSDAPASQARSGPPAMDPASGTLAGEVAERLDAGSYTYVRVVDGAGESSWIVTLGEAEPPGARVRVTRIGARRGFHSARLDRTFDHLVFGIVRAD